MVELKKEGDDVEGRAQRHECHDAEAGEQEPHPYAHLYGLVADPEDAHVAVVPVRLVHGGVNGRREGDADPEGRDRERDPEEMEILPGDLEDAAEEWFHAEEDCQDDRPGHDEDRHRVTDDGRDLVTWSAVSALGHHLLHGHAYAQVEHVRVGDDRRREHEDPEPAVAHPVHDECGVGKARHRYEPRAQIVVDDAADNLRCSHRAEPTLLRLMLPW
jgi:hypothetical protein